MQDPLPPGTVEEAVAAATDGESVVECERLCGGVENEAWAVTTSSGARLVIRVAPDEAADFEAERWAIERALRAGVPAPKVLWTKGPVCHRTPGRVGGLLPNVDLRLRLHRLFVAVVLGSFGVEAQRPYVGEQAAVTLEEHLTRTR